MHNLIVPNNDHQSIHQSTLIYRPLNHICRCFKVFSTIKRESSRSLQSKHVSRNLEQTQTPRVVICFDWLPRKGHINKAEREGEKKSQREYLLWSRKLLCTVYWLLSLNTLCSLNISDPWVLSLNWAVQPGSFKAGLTDPCLLIFRSCAPPARERRRHYSRILHVLVCAGLYLIMS